ncbi:hypothetical protein WJX74_008783 [Apatococcus lobatus]
MDAVTFHGPRDMRVSRRPVPVLQQPTDIVVKVKLASICGSDMHPYAGRGVQLDAGIIFGHEFVGEVVDVGSEVKNTKIGDRVASAFTSSCGSCFYCSHDLTCRCSHEEAGRFGYIIDGNGPQGIQAEFARVPLADSTVVPVHDSVTDIEALMLGDILPTGWYCAAKADVEPMAKKHGDGISAAVVGCGPVGLMAILAAQAQGATHVFAVDKVPDRLELAKQFGAEPINGEDVDAAIAAVKDATGGRGVDCAMEAVGHQATVNMSFNMLRMGGTLSSVGLHTDEEFKAFTPWDGYNKNITYRNGRCPARVYMDDIHKLVKNKHWGDPFPGEKLITHRVSLHDEAAVREVYDKFERRIDNCTKVLLIP